jgi:hypothetical protein
MEVSVMNVIILALTLALLLVVFVLVVARPHLKIIRPPGAQRVTGEPTYFMGDSTTACSDAGSDGGSCDGGAGH